MKRILAAVVLLCLTVPARAETTTVEDSLQFARQCAWFGNYAMAERVLEETDQAYRQLSPAPEPLAWWDLEMRAFRLGLRWQRRLGDPVPESRTLIAEARRLGGVETELWLHLLVLLESRRSVRPELYDEMVQRARELAARPGGSPERVARFILQTLDMERAHRQNGMTVAEFVRRNDEAFALLDSLPDDEPMRKSALIWRMMGEACILWGEVRWALEAELGPVPELAAAGQRDSSILLGLYPTGEVGNRLELGLAMLDLSFDLVALWRNTRLGERNAVYLRSLGPDIEKFLALARSADAKYTHGSDVWRVPGRYCQEVARQLLHEHPGRLSDPIATETASYLARAREYFATADSTLSLRELRLDEVDFLLRQQPAGWEAQVEAALTELERTPVTSTQARVWLDRGRLRLAQKRSKEAGEALERALSLSETFLREAEPGPYLRARVRAVGREAAERLAALQVQAGHTDAAFQTRSRLGQMEAWSRMDLGRVRAAGPERRQALERVARARERVAAREQQLARDPSAGELLAADRAEYYRAVRELEKSEPGMRSLNVRPGSFSNLQNDLPEEAAVVLLFPAPESLYFFVATRERLVARRVEVPATRLDELATAYRRHVATEARSSKGAGPEFLAVASELYDALVAPIEGDVADKSVLAYVPSGKLLYLPLAGLVRTRDGRSEYLAERKQVVTLIKTTDLMHRTGRERSAGMVALGDPDGSLPAARREVSLLQELDPDAQVFVGEQATVERVRALEGKPVGVLHLATHGQLNSDDPFSSFLLLAGGQLKVSDIAGMSLHGVSMVTLSACQTALADRSPEPGQELASLADAFNYAGSPCLVASLWKVSDESTAVLMEEMYRSLARGESRAEALRRGQLKVMSRPETRHPFYWAGFILLGDWR
ncbi:MAG: CHAT domain-containing protein [Candidatus Eremiobacterota bacterium]